MTRRRWLIISLLVASLFFSGACSALLFPASPNQGKEQPAVLTRCRPDPVALCLVAFGLDQDQLWISFFVPPGGPADFDVKVRHKDAETAYTCTMDERALSAPLACIGPPIPLGTTVGIELYDTASKTLMARGEFTINALALSTPEVERNLPFVLPGVSTANAATASASP